MRTPLPPVNEPLSLLQTRLQKEKRAPAKQRLHMLVLFKSGQANTRRAAADHLAVHRNTIAQWITRYQNEGIEALLKDQKRGPNSGQRILSKPALEALKARLDTPEGFGSYGEIQQWLDEEFGLEANYKRVHHLVRYHLGAKLKVGRRSHVKKN